METLLKVEGINVYYGAIHAIKDISFQVNQGEIVTLIGANGAGKTTTLQTVSGLLRSKTGSILFDGQDINTVSADKLVGRGLAQVPEGRRVFLQMSVEENLEMGAYLHKKPTREELKDIFTRFPRLQERRDQVAGTLSGGEQQLVLIARALAQNARTIIMDEPTSALDYGNTVRVLSTVRQLAREGMSIVQSTHQPDQAFLYADQTLVINDGRVHAFGNPKDVITKELVSTIYDVDVEVNSLYGDKVRVCVPVREIER